MKNTRIGSRYAKAFFELALEQGFLEQAREDMLLVLQVYQTSKEFKLLMNNPVVPAAKKASVVKSIFSGKLHEGSQLFLNILTHKRREMHVDAIAEEFLRLYKEHKNIKTAQLQTAVPADETTRSAVIRLVKDRFHCEVELLEEVNPNLIGGFILKVDDFQYDTSIRSELNLLKKEFRENVYKKGI